MESTEGELERESTQENVSSSENVVIKEEPRDTEEELEIPENVVVKEEPEEPEEEVLENVVIKEEPPEVEEPVENFEEPRKLSEDKWNELGLSEEDLEKLKDGRIEELSEEAKQTLQDLSITEEMVADAILTTIQEADDYPKISDVSEELEQEVKEPSKVEVPEIPKKSFAEYLLEKGLSANFTQALIKAGITDEATKFFKSIAFTEEDIWIIEALWEVEKSKVETDSMAPADSGCVEYLSPNGVYLKQNLSRPLIEGLRETVARKPFDPVEYLAHWLHHFKVCEERSRKQREFELELQIQREKMTRQGLDDFTSVQTYTDREEEAPVQDDWDFLNYNL